MPAFRECSTPRSMITLTGAREAIIEAGLRFESDQEVGQGIWVIMAKKETSAFSWGELVRSSSEPPEATWVRF